ncbi:DUF5302 domain-containing protein [Arthrobacter russicus]|jgi:hypothetical protein|uniref:DUF5302 domain-containing protein n=1 Tax=Arthrobacter russicus TaxID=172040 RepID=A0ABU1JFA8_9MICC|nr:DUF5302 domain-containing protein [Arthrobacter russicus]MDN5669449.1 DUF5302 domain-containing protein [Renibacterium salmoninarum]MDR6270820.1 hypothetical protein [Arthrobacter russicus]
MSASGQDQNASTEDHSASEQSASEDTKRKFREALEKKNAKHHATVEASQNTKISTAHASAATKREFRRKSG